MYNEFQKIYRSSKGYSLTFIKVSSGVKAVSYLSERKKDKNK